MDGFPILTTLLLLPLIGVLLMFITPVSNNEGEKNSSDKMFFRAGIWISIFCLILVVVVASNYNQELGGIQFLEKVPWLSFSSSSDIVVYYVVGVDSISLLFILLTAGLVPICLIVAFRSVKTGAKRFVMLFLILESSIIGSFIALDLLLFYLFFELMLIPMFMIIGIWGGEQRIYASFKFFLYTLFGSVLFLIAIIYILITTGTTNLLELLEMGKLSDSSFASQLLWGAFFIAFAIKIPIWPLHTWLPTAHVQAPTVGSIILAGVLIKIGAYGFIRFLLPLFPNETIEFAPIVLGLSVIGIIYTSLIALIQTDIKKIVAYSSVAHMGYVVIGIFSLNRNGIDGAIFQMIAHGIVSGALFFAIGIIYERLHTREEEELGGLASKMGIYCRYLLIFVMSSIALPGTVGFVGEFLVLLGAFKENYIVSVLAATAVVLGATYMLRFYRIIALGEVKNIQRAESISDVDVVERVLLIIFAVFTIGLGVYPNFILSFSGSSVESLVSIYKGLL